MASSQQFRTQTTNDQDVIELFSPEEDKATNKENEDPEVLKRNCLQQSQLIFVSEFPQDKQLFNIEKDACYIQYQNGKFNFRILLNSPMFWNFLRRSQACVNRAIIDYAISQKDFAKIYGENETTSLIESLAKNPSSVTQLCQHQNHMTHQKHQKLSEMMLGLISNIQYVAGSSQCLQDEIENRYIAQVFSPFENIDIEQKSEQQQTKTEDYFSSNVSVADSLNALFSNKQQRNKDTSEHLDCKKDHQIAPNQSMCQPF